MAEDQDSAASFRTDSENDDLANSNLVGHSTSDSDFSQPAWIQPTDLSDPMMSVECTESNSNRARAVMRSDSNDSNRVVHEQCSDDTDKTSTHSAQLEVGEQGVNLPSRYRGNPLETTGQGQLLSQAQRKAAEGFSARGRSWESMPPSFKAEQTARSSLPKHKAAKTLDPHESLLLRNQPARFIDTPSVNPEELLKAHRIVDRVLKENPKALGTVLLVHHRNAPESVELEPLDKIEEGTAKLYSAFTDLMLAVVRLKNPSTQLLKAVMMVMASPKYPNMKFRIEYPDSYKFFFFYTTGHGARRVFFTKDCAVAYSTVYEQFQGLFKQRYFFFDCCRCVKLDDISLYADQEGTRELPEIPGHGIKAGNKIIYATLDEERSLGPGKDSSTPGVSFMTLKMIALLRKRMSIDDMIKKLKEEVPAEVKNPDTGRGLQPMMVDAMSSDIDLVAMRDQAMKPQLRAQPQISPNNIVAHFPATLASPLVRSESFSFSSVHLRMKTDENTWRDLEDKVAPQGIPIPGRHQARPRSRTFEQQSVQMENPADDVLSSSLVENETSCSSPSPPSYDRVPRTVTVELPIERPDNEAEFRLVVRYSNKTELEFESDSLFFQLPPVVVPKIESAYLTWMLCLKTGLNVTWTMDQTLNTPIQQFTVDIFAGDPQNAHALKSDFVPAKAGHDSRERYCHTVSIPDYSDQVQYTVVVTPEQTAWKKVPSVHVAAKKGCCLKHIGKIKIALILFFLLLTLPFVVVLVVNHKEMDDSCTFTAPDAMTDRVFEAQSNINSECPLQGLAYVFSQRDLRQQSVIRIDSEPSDAKSVYCAEFPDSELVTSRGSVDVGPDKTNIDQHYSQNLSHNVRSLPIGPTPFYDYLLSRSVFSVYVCLAGTVNGLVPEVYALLFRYEDRFDLKNAQPLHRELIRFDSSLCSNTSLTLSNSALIVSALSTSDTVTLKVIQGYVKRYFYTSKVRNLLQNTTNLITSEKMKHITGDASSKLLCYATGNGEAGQVFCNALRITISLIWKLWALSVMIVSIVVIVIIVLCGLAGCFCKKLQSRLCLCCKRRHYLQIPINDEDTPG